MTTYIEDHQICFRLDIYFMAAVLAANRYSRGESLCLAVSARRVMVPCGSTLHLEPGTILSSRHCTKCFWHQIYVMGYFQLLC